MIKPAHPSDDVQLTYITQTAKAHWGYPMEWLNQWREELTVTPGFIRAHEVHGFWVEETCVGYVAWTRQSEEIACLDSLFVLPAFMGRRIGVSLLNFARERIWDSGYRQITLDADPHAVDFYLKHGFRVVDRFESSIPGRYLPVMVLDRG
ncbi:GNAT family N-acetyltransferase [Pontibacter sp. G13]|uniref:GNAT family N-acetyltransferase n=1 Tax=Pontibacter sp. G13 TaxID=3074898 RepID=UPI00288C5D41|nr:GNAT family N-acetyltransferase [Pontibacter sp. G13]WNJ18775.1 GNAT family N-acetyltransferase [Pontibacter sp. G13]